MWSANSYRMPRPRIRKRFSEMAWDFSPQWGCLNYMTPDYLNNPHSLVNHYSKMMGQNARDPKGPMLRFHPQPPFGRPHSMALMRGGPRLRNPPILRARGDNMAWHNGWRPTGMFPQSWAHNNQQQHPMQPKKYFARDVPVSWHPNNFQCRERGLCQPQEPDLTEYIDDTYQNFETETLHYPEEEYPHPETDTQYHEADAHHEADAQYHEADYQYHEVDTQYDETDAPYETDGFHSAEPESFHHSEPQHFQFGQPSWFPDFSQKPMLGPGPIRRRNQKKVREDVPYQRTQRAPVSVYKLQVQLKQLGNNLQSLSVEWKEGSQVPALSTMCVAVYDDAALTNIVWLDKPGSYIFTLFGKTGIKIEAYQLNALANKRGARYVSASGKCNLKISTDSEKHETVELKKRTCDRNLLDALVMEDCFTMTQENTTKTFYEIRMVKSDDFIMVEDGLMFDTRLSSPSSTNTPENKKKRKLSVESMPTTATFLSSPQVASPAGLPSISTVSGTSSDCMKEAVPQPSAGPCLDTSVENDISSFLILDSTLNQSDVEADKYVVTGVLGTGCENGGNENEPPNKKMKGSNKTKSIFSQLKLKAEELVNSLTSKSSCSSTVSDRKKLKAKRENFQTASVPNKSTATVSMSEGNACVGHPPENKPVLPKDDNSETLCASTVTKSSDSEFTAIKSTELQPVSFRPLVAPQKQALSSASSELQVKASPATTKIHPENKSSVVSTDKLSTAKPAVTPSDNVMNRSVPLVDDLEGKEMLLLLRFTRSGKVYFIRGSIKNGAISIPFSLVPSERYEGRMFELENLVSSSQPYYSIQRVSNYLTFTTQMTLDQLGELLGLSEAFIMSNLPKYHHLNYFYRNKPDAYFDDIFENHNGVMKPYMKDFNGDQGSPINGKLKGLFFSASVSYSNGKIPQTSCFGEKRLYIPAIMLFSRDMGLYFTDFYCTTASGNGPHYATLVMTKKDSEADVFCRSRLLSLNPFNNPFMYKQNTRKGWQVFTCTTKSILHVEVLYTEEVDIKTLLDKHKGEVRFEYVEIFGRGHSSVKGIPKNRRCPTCNNLNQFPISSEQQA